jgi:steroid 5-alpha reductase family enzyme
MNIYLIASVTAFLYMTLFFCIAQYKKDNSLVDIAWGTGFILVALVTLWYTNLFLWRQIIVTTLVFIWGSRLAFHIFKRHKGEDPRYVEMRKQWGKDVVVKSFFYIFMLQGLLLLIISYPIIAINADTTIKTLSLFDFLGVAIWIFGFCFEALSDHQLQEFIRNPGSNTQPA